LLLKHDLIELIELPLEMRVTNLEVYEAPFHRRRIAHGSRQPCSAGGAPPSPLSC
jgi:hypothetical protein